MTNCGLKIDSLKVDFWLLIFRLVTLDRIIHPHKSESCHLSPQLSLDSVHRLKVRPLCKDTSSVCQLTFQTFFLHDELFSVFHIPFSKS